ncbi:DNA polymerase/3'-5' exonuclease PolX [Verrucomicrobia bacterium]|jgi:DNA polymerase (family X)|nr:DNA polymerase/3'-5' exonuclease PolX [Verrucomicrobiota bacterium]MDB4798041.1 DNA polymerase/3'-5' exonuclease PolX [Verrucomicrobiota bacterium]
MDKEAVIEALEEIAVLLELKGENPFKTRAYVNAGRTLERWDGDLKQWVDEERLGEIKGFGEALQQKVTELVTTGKLIYLDDLKASVPAGLIEMLNLPGLGPKKIKVLNKELDITTVEALEAACQAGQVATLSGFGAKTQQKILDGIEFRRRYASQHRVDKALTVAEPILERLRSHPDVIRCSLAGSLRRHKEVIGDVDFLVSAKESESIIKFFCEQDEVESVIAAGETKSSVIVTGGVQADLRVVSDQEFPFALAYFTGSKEHNIVMRQRAIQRGLRLNEYGLFRSKEETRDSELLEACSTEEEIFAKLELPYIPPELREDHGEFEAGDANELPRLLEWTELRGSLHNHSNWSDGRQTLEEIIDHCQDLGCAYWAVTDHSKSSFQANGLDAVRLRKQIKTIKTLNQQLESEGVDFRLLTGSEVDILGEGNLDFDDELLSELEVVVASVHNGFTQSESQLTNRFVKAAENPFVHMLGHLTGRLLLERNPYAVNQKAVIDVCAETGTWIELNASPYRFDLDWRMWRYAQKKGVRCVVNCDAHRAEHAGFLRLGAGIARKGWLTKKDVVNTQVLADLRQSLALKRAG